MIVKGISIPTARATGEAYPNKDKPFSIVNYEQITSLKLNSVVFAIWWSQVENEDGSFNEDFLLKLEKQIHLAQSVGLKVFLGFRCAYGVGNAKDWMGWSAPLGADYVNLDMEGRNRYITMLQMMAQRFAKVGIVPWFFPYHGEQPNALQTETYYTVTLRLFYSELRKVTSQPLILNPLSQGQSGSWSEGLCNGQYDIIDENGWFMFPLDANLYFGFSNHGKEDNFKVCQRGETWDYDMTRLNAHYEPLVRLKEEHNVKFVCVESLAMQIHGDLADRPIEKSRLDWAEAQHKKMEELGLGWFYFRYENPPTGSSPIDEDSSVNEVGLLLRKYGVEPSGETPFLLLFFVMLAIVFLASLMIGRKQ